MGFDMWWGVDRCSRSASSPLNEISNTKWKSWWTAHETNFAGHCWRLLHSTAVCYSPLIFFYPTNTPKVPELIGKLRFLIRQNYARITYRYFCLDISSMLGVCISKLSSNICLKTDKVSFIVINHGIKPRPVGKQVHCYKSKIVFIVAPCQRSQNHYMNGDIMQGMSRLWRVVHNFRPNWKCYQMNQI